MAIATRRATDPQIIDLVVQGRPAGLALLYERYGPLSYSLAMRILGAVGPAEDTVEESFLSIWRGGASSYQEARGPVRGWLCSIVHHRALHRLRGRERWIGPELPHEAATSRILGATWDQRDSAEPRRDDVRDALAELTAEQREIIELAYFAGCSQVEIGDSLMLPVGAVKSATRHALSSLREGLTVRTPMAAPPNALGIR